MLILPGLFYCVDPFCVDDNFGAMRCLLHLITNTRRDLLIRLQEVAPQGFLLLRDILAFYNNEVCASIIMELQPEEAVQYLLRDTYERGLVGVELTLLAQEKL